MQLNNKRKELVDKLKDQGIIKSQKVYDAMNKIPRHEFIPEKYIDSAYEDRPISIGKGQTISAPHMNAMMCELLDLAFDQKVLEIGTGSGYHAALLSYIVGNSGKVYTIERIEKLAKNAETVYKKLGINNINVICGDGTVGYEKESPYDRILVTAAGPKIVDALIEQLNPDGGKMCVPIGKKNSTQTLYLIEKNNQEITKKKVCNVIFVPLIGKNAFS